MKKSFENLSRAEHYEAPALEVYEIASEGVLCASGEFGIDDWAPDGDGLDF